MTIITVRRLYSAIALAASLLLASCGGGTTAGVGGSGIGGTGITSATVNGNVVQVTAHLFDPYRDQHHSHLLAALVAAVDNPVMAQSGFQSGFGVSGIEVAGGGKQTVTDTSGRFSLPDVVPNNNFVLTLTLPSGKQVNLAVGVVPAGTIVEVRNIVINTSQNKATPDQIEVQDDPAKDDDGSSDNGGSSADEDSRNEDPESPESESESESESSEDDNSTDNSGETPS